MKRYFLIAGLVIPVVVLAAVYHNNKILIDIGTLELFLIAVAINSFVIIYSRRRWRSNPYGRALMYSKASLAVLVDLSLAVSLIGFDWEYRGFARVLVFGGILFAQFRLLQLLYSAKSIAAQEAYFERMGHAFGEKKND